MNEPVIAKKPWLSKTLWLGVATAIAAFFPPVQDWIAGNPTTFSWILTGAFALVRLITKNAISIK